MSHDDVQGIHDEHRTLPLVTIITPTYNRARYLKETIESVLVQDYPNIEYLVAVDGSTDETCALLEQYSGRLQWEWHEKIGQTETLNRAFAVARGEYIMALSDSDVIVPDAVTRLVGAFAEHPETVIVYPDFDFIDTEGKYASLRLTPDYSYIDMVRYVVSIAGGATLFRRSLLDAIGAWNASIRTCPDFEWYLRAGLVGPFHHVRRVLVSSRYYPESHNKEERGQCMAREIVQVIENFYDRPDLPEEIRALRDESLRSAYFVGGLVIRGIPNTPDERARFADCLSQVRDAAQKNEPPPQTQTPKWMIGWPEVVAGRPETELINVIAERNNAIGWLQGSVAELTNVITERNNIIAELQDSVAELTRIIAGRNEVVAQLQGSEAELTTIIAARDKVIARIEGSVADLNAVIAGRNKAITQLESLVTDQTAAIADQKTSIAWLEGSVSDKTAVIADQKKSIAWLQGEVQWREAALAERDKAIAWLQRQTAELADTRNGMPQVIMES